MIGFYVILLTFTAYNTVVYCTRQVNKGKFYLVSFYSLVYLDIAIRVSWLALILNVVHN